MTTLTLDALTKTYPGSARPALDRLSLDVASGSLTALLGPSGSGKTTAMKLIAGLLSSDAGEVRLGDRPLAALPPEKRGVVMVFQNPLLFPHLTLAENVGFGLRMRHLPGPEVATRTRAMLARTRLTGLQDRRPHQLSGGQQQRAALARALVLEPQLLLLDEPLSNLDPTLRDEMRALILSLQRETGITTLVVTHDQSEAVVLADRIALLFDGQLAQYAEPEDFYRRPASKAVAQFFGGVNFLPGHAAGGVFHGPFGPLTLPHGLSDGPGLLTIRPEAVLLGDGPNALAAAVTAVTFLGTQTRIDLQVGATALQALIAPDRASGLTPGQTLTIALPSQALWVLPG